MLLTNEEILGCLTWRAPNLVARAIEAAVLEKLCAGVEMPEAFYWVYEAGTPGGYFIEASRQRKTGGYQDADAWNEAQVFTTDQLRAYGAAQRLKALEDAEQVCATISDKFFKRDGGKWPELRTDAETGAGHCKDAIRALKGEAP